MKLMAAGDQVLVAEFGDRIDEAVNDQVHALAAKIEEQQIPGIGEVVPTFRSLLIYYDSYQLSYREAADKIEELARNLKTEQKTKKRILKIPCCYGARFGPDLADMEQLTGLDRKEMIDIHSSVDYKVYMLGFLPGFAYLGGLDERIHVPRLKSPRLKISRGAVGIGGSQTGIYPMDSPGGWRLMKSASPSLSGKPYGKRPYAPLLPFPRSMTGCLPPSPSSRQSTGKSAAT